MKMQGSNETVNNEPKTLQKRQPIISPAARNGYIARNRILSAINKDNKGNFETPLKPPVLA